MLRLKPIKKGSEMGAVLKKLAVDDGSWADLEENWRKECESFSEDFDAYVGSAYQVCRDLAHNPEPKSGVVSLCDEGAHKAICQLNVARLPGFDGPVLRVRHLTASPNFDLGEQPAESYGKVLVDIFFEVVRASLGQTVSGFEAGHIKFHLPSPSDRPFFTMLGEGLSRTDAFETVRMQGAWLYITLSNRIAGQKIEGS